MKKLARAMGKLSASLFLAIAAYSVNVACSAYIGQDEVPNAAMKLRKF